MSIVYGLSLVCDLYYFLACVGLLGMLMGASPAMLALPLLLGIGAGLGFKWFPQRKLKFLPLLLGAAVIPFGFGGREGVMFVPSVIYSIFYIANNKHATDYYYAFRRFLGTTMAMPFFWIFAMVGDGVSVPSAMPAVFLYFALSISQLRMLRHEDRIIRQRKFQLLNLLGMAAVCAVGAVLSTDWVLRLLRKLLELLNRYVLMPVLEALAWVLRGVMWVLGKIEALFPHFDGDAPMPNMGMGGESVGATGLMDEITAEELAGNPVVKTVLTVLGIAALCVGVFFLLRALSKHSARTDTGERREQRERIEESGSAENAVLKVSKRRGDSALNVRYQYIRFLRLARARGIDWNERQNSLQIRDASAAKFEEAPLDALREVYIRARYGGEQRPDDLRIAQEALAQLKKNPTPRD